MGCNVDGSCRYLHEMLLESGAVCRNVTSGAKCPQTEMITNALIGVR